MQEFEGLDKKTAKTVIERSVRKLEAKDKTAQTSSVDIVKLTAEIDYSERYKFITPEQAENFRMRIEKAQKEFERLERTETRDVVNDFENPREQATRYRGLDDYKSQIVEERAKEQKEDKSTESRTTTATRSSDERTL
jgi:uncharacterized protein YfbU (UPF0304 family)